MVQKAPPPGRGARQAGTQPRLSCLLFSQVEGPHLAISPRTVLKGQAVQAGAVERWFAFRNCWGDGILQFIPRAPQGPPALPLPARPKWGEGPVGRLGVDPEKGQTRGTPFCLSGHAAFSLHPAIFMSSEPLGGRTPLTESIALSSLDENQKGQIMPGKKERKKNPQRTTKHLSSPSTLTPKSLGVLFQALSLGEKNEIRFKRVFMENRFCAQCLLSQESLALGRPWLGWEAALGPLPRVPPRATEGGPWVGLVCSVTP